jgi:hypothetical protein
MSKKIKSLTPEQLGMIPVYRDRWLKIGLSTEPTDRPAAIAAARRCYESTGLVAPDKFIFASSPIEATNIGVTLGAKNQREVFSNFCWNQHEAGSLAFYAFFHEVVGLSGLEKIEPLLDLAKLCGWVSFYDTAVIIQDRPEIIRFDDRGLLHAENGPSVRYRDGFSVYSWHGVRIPGEWMTKPPTATEALHWDNMEQRRAACEIVGWVNILRELNAKTIDKDDDPMVGELVRVDIPDIGEEQFLRVLCGTGREFALPVPPTMRTALEANAWSYDIPEDFIRNLEVRT